MRAATFMLMAMLNVVAVASAAAASTVEAVTFANAQQQSLYREMLTELRCLVCANQSLADSDADLAKDLRGKIQKMVAQGQHREAILEYMVDRYGEYILYRPRFSFATWVLWLSPFLCVVLGLVIAVMRITKRASHPTTAYSSQQLQQANALLGDDTHC